MVAPNLPVEDYKEINVQYLDQDDLDDIQPLTSQNNSILSSKHHFRRLEDLLPKKPTTVSQHAQCDTTPKQDMAIQCDLIEEQSGAKYLRSIVDELNQRENQMVN